MVVWCPDLNLMFMHVPRASGSSVTSTLEPWVQRKNSNLKVGDRQWLNGCHLIGRVHTPWNESIHGWMHVHLVNGATCFYIQRNPLDRARSVIHHRRHHPWRAHLWEGMTDLQIISSSEGFFPLDSQEFAGPYARPMLFDTRSVELPKLMGKDVVVPHINKAWGDGPPDLAEDAAQWVIEHCPEDMARWTTLMESASLPLPSSSARAPASESESRSGTSPTSETEPSSDRVLVWDPTASSTETS